MTDYYGDVLRTVPPNLAPDELPNLSSIAKERSIPDIVKFLRLVLALAVKSDKKEDYVQKIYTLSPETQKSLMFLLQQVVPSDSKLRVDCVDPIAGKLFRRRIAEVKFREGLLLTNSEDDQIRFEQEIAEISAERDSIEKARLELLDEHESLKAESVSKLNTT
jgi:HOOK domain